MGQQIEAHYRLLWCQWVGCHHYQHPAKQVIYMAQNILLGNIHFHLSNKMNPCLQGKKLFYGADWYYFHMLHLLQISCHLWLNIQFYKEKDNPTNKYRHNHQFLQYIPYFELINTVCYSLGNYQNYYYHPAKLKVFLLVWNKVYIICSI